MADVTKNGEGTWDYQCPRSGECGSGGVSFRSTGWPTKEHAAARGAQHATEHEAGEIMQDLHEFRVERGLVDTKED